MPDSLKKMSLFHSQEGLTGEEACVQCLQPKANTSLESLLDYEWPSLACDE
jgi:hypothetical protein